MTAIDKKYKEIDESYESIQEWNKHASDWTQKHYGCEIRISYNPHPKVKSWQVYAQYGLQTCLLVCASGVVEDFLTGPITRIKEFFNGFNINPNNI
jgi:hypothetical protein